MSESHSKAAKAATRVLPEEDPEFQIAPMIDILLVLLVFFMTIATDQVLQVNKDVVLPVATAGLDPETGKDSGEVIVNVLWGEKDPNKVVEGDMGHLDVEGKGPMGLKELTDYIISKKTAVESKGQTNFRVVIRADRNAKYQYVRTVMVAVGAASVPTVVFSAVDKASVPKE